MPFGEMTVTLQDVAMLTELPIAGDIIAGVVDGAVFQIAPTQKNGPKKQWLQQFKVRQH